VDSWFLQAQKILDPLRRPRRMLRGVEAETTLDRVVSEDGDGAPEDPSGDAAFGFALRLGRALLSFGLPAQRLEEALTRVAAALGHTIDCFSTPTALMVTMSDGKRRRTRVVRLEPGETDLERMSALHALVGRVERRELSPQEGSKRIEKILARAPRYRASTTVLGFGLASAASVVLLGGGASDLLPALSLGTVVGLLARLAMRVPTLGRILPALAALATTLLARAIELAGAPVHEPELVLAALIVLLPGFTLTIATMELATANLVSGTSRLAGGLSALLQLAFGVALGHRVAQLLPQIAAAPAQPTPEWLVLAAYAAAALSFTVLLRAAPRDVAWILVGAAVSVAGARLGQLWLGPEIGAVLGALLLGLASHVYARMKDRPVLLMMTPGILMLVPGSVGFLSVSSMLAADVVTALETAFRMILIATSLAAGLLVATLAVPPRRAL
jgi:uncharacterized membrane protein YjjP (DUF1212 family)